MNFFTPFIGNARDFKNTGNAGAAGVARIPARWKFYQ
jgi:hypothetical protein